MDVKYPIKDNEFISSGTDLMGRKWKSVAIEWKPGHFKMERVYFDNGTGGNT